MNQNLYQEAVKAARAGERERARDLFLDIVDDNPREERAWLWLSGLLDDTDDQITALRNALKLNPEREQARQRLAMLQQKKEDWKQAQRKAAGAVYQEAMVAIGRGNLEKARDLLLQVVSKNPEHEAAWLRLSELMPTADDQIVALENVLTINPEQVEARRQLQMLQEMRHNPLALAAEFRYQGRYLQARIAYEQAQLSTDPQVRLAAAQQLASMAEEARHGRVPQQAVYTLLRLALGPPLLYALLVFVQIGFRPANLTLLYCLGGVGIIAGTALVTGLQVMPRHAFWQKLFGPRGIRPLPVQYGLWAAGLLLVLLPFLLLASRAAVRLDSYRAAVFGG